MLNVALERVDGRQVSEASEVLHGLREAQESLEACFAELEGVLDRPEFDGGALTSVRLKLAGIRLTRGPLIIRVAELLAGQVSQAEEAVLQQLRESHHRLLKTATVHTSKWTLDAIAKDWPEYRRETRELMRKWVSKAQQEQRLIYPLVRRCAAQ
jgi:DNA repair ATPase RecN